MRLPMYPWAASVLLMLCLAATAMAGGNAEHNKHLSVTLPKVFLRDVPSSVQLTLPELDNDGHPWPELVPLSIYR